MKLSYPFDLDDWTSFQRHHFNRSPGYRRLRMFSRFVFPVLAIALIISRISAGGFDPIFCGFFALFAVIWFVFYPRWFDRKLIRRSTQFLNEGNNDSLFGTREIELLPDRIHVVSPAGETTYRASAVKKIVETPDALLLYISSLQALVFPRKKLSESEYDQVKTLAEQYYSGRAV